MLCEGFKVSIRKAQFETPSSLLPMLLLNADLHFFYCWFFIFFKPLNKCFVLLLSSGHCLRESHLEKRDDTEAGFSQFCGYLSMIGYLLNARQ